MRVAVLISGQMRSVRHCFPSIEKHLLSRIGENDVYAHIADDAQASSLDLFNPKLAWVGAQPDLDEKNYIHRTGRQVFGVQQCLRMWWSMWQAYELMKSSDTEYDFVVRLRPDTQFLSPIEIPETWSNGVTLPKHNNWWGYCDRFAIMSASWACAYHSLWPNLDNYISQGGIFHPETYLKWNLDQAAPPIHRTSVLFDTVRLDGNRVLPTFSEKTGDVLV